MHARNFKNSHTLSPCNVNKYVVGKNGEREVDPQTVIPLALCLIERQITFNIPQFKVLLYSLFMTRGSVNRKPSRQRNRIY
jgi:hypothetical protein